MKGEMERCYEKSEELSLWVANINY